MLAVVGELGARGRFEPEIGPKLTLGFTLGGVLYSEPEAEAKVWSWVGLDLPEPTCVVA